MRFLITQPSSVCMNMYICNYVSDFSYCGKQHLLFSSRLVRFQQFSQPFLSLAAKEKEFSISFFKYGILKYQLYILLTVRIPPTASLNPSTFAIEAFNLLCNTHIHTYMHAYSRMTQRCKATEKRKETAAISQRLKSCVQISKRSNNLTSFFRRSTLSATIKLRLTLSAQIQNTFQKKIILKEIFSVSIYAFIVYCMSIYESMYGVYLVRSL